MKKLNSHLEHGQPMAQTRGLFALATPVWPVSLLANEFIVQSVLHGQVSFAAVNQFLCNS